MKSSRLLSMMLMLQSVERRSARELAAALEVSERTIYRDVDALSQSGVPIYTERGVNGGIALSEGYRNALMHFDEGEIRALFISGSNPLADLGLGVEHNRALEKLSGAMSDLQRKAAEKTRGRIHLDQKRWNQAEQPQDFLALLRRAVWEDRCVEMHYRDRDAKVTQRRIEPLGLVAKAGIWYVVARDNDAYRTFRAERIIGVTLLTQTFVRPPAFDLDSYWHDATSAMQAQGKNFPTILRVGAQTLEVISRYWDAQIISEPEPEATETILVRVLFPTRETAMGQIIHWGNTVSVIEPVELIDDIVTRASDIVKHYRPITAV
jgi:predicted DNA-binding transcriptional regulator YafY